MKTIDYGKKPGMHPAPMITRVRDYAEAVEHEVTIENDEWKAHYQLLTIYNGEVRVSATYYLIDVEVKK